MSKVGLLILDGWGHGKLDHTNAIFNANTPFVDGLYEKYPHAELKTFGPNVGLPDGQMGNSEVGHLNIGAGRIVYQDLVRINKEISDEVFDENPELIRVFHKAREKNRLHLMGLVSDGGVHSHINHCKALIKAAHSYGIEHIYIHAFTDGRDCDPHSGLGFLTDLETYAQQYKAEISTVVGRYYSMDRDLRWERVAEAYHLMVNGKGKKFDNLTSAIKESYDAGVSDEFIKPIVLGAGQIEDDDTVLCFNFRTDRCREITRALTQEDIHEQNMHALHLDYTTMTMYDASFQNVHVLYSKDNLSMTLGEYVSTKGLKQLRMAETEKYPHVTFFFSGGRENVFNGENRIVVNSPKVATYDLKPEMSAYEVRDQACSALKEDQPDFLCLNFANTDMVGHTGVFDAVVKAAEAVDICVKDVITTGLELGYQFIVIADHGNADLMINEDGSPHTAHTLNPVPIICVSDKYQSINQGILADVAPSILKMMELDQPKEMTGTSLI